MESIDVTFQHMNIFSLAILQRTESLLASSTFLKKKFRVKIRDEGVKISKMYFLNDSNPAS